MISNSSSGGSGGAEMEIEWPSYLNEYEKLVIRMNTPRVVVDNASCDAATLVKVDSARDHALLLDTVQVLTDLDLLISKAYISSDGPYFMDVFHVTDSLGLKLADLPIISLIEHSIQSSNHPVARASGGGGGSSLTALELTGADRPGILSEIFAVMSDLRCVVFEARVWTHNGCIASVIFVDGDDAAKMRRVESRLGHVVQGTVVSSAAGLDVDRRLHQMMSADLDYEKSDGVSVSVQSSIQRGYSIVNVACRDRPKLLFDMVCNLTLMNYVIFHGNIDTDGDRANQEFYIRHTDGTPISSEAERHRVIQCLQAAIERRSYNGLKLKLEICTSENQRTLAEVTRAFRENGLLVTRAEVSTSGDTATNVFYVTDAAGNSPGVGVIDSVRQRIGSDCLRVIEEKVQGSRASRETVEGDDGVSNKGVVGLFNIGSLVLRNLYNLGLIRSCS